MGLEDLVGTALVVGGTIYVVDKLTGKRRKIKIPSKKVSRRTVKTPRRSGTVKRSNIRKAVKRSPPKRLSKKK